MGASVMFHRGHPIIEHFWERWYRDYPELYDRFALSSVAAAHELEAMFGFQGATVLALAAGTGRDAFEIARTAARVVCVEPSASMRDLAIRRRDELGAVNTEFVDAVAEDLSAFTDASFDRVVSIHGAPFLPWDAEGLTARESLRVVRPGGHVAFVTTTPGWRMDHEPAATEQPMARDALAEQLEPLGFTPRDVLVEMDYGSVDEALATWGCIYGADAIDYLLERQTSRLTWSLRIWHHMA